MWEYSEKVKEHFFNPRNVGEIKDADAVGEVGSLACGDALKLYLKLDENGRIEEAKFQTFGCGSAIASSSALTEMIKGLTLDEALKITNRDIANFLGGLPEEKMHCSVMGKEALEVAISNYRGIKIHAEEEGEGKLICRCFGVSEGQIRRVIKENNLSTVEQVTNYCKAGGACGSCVPEIEDILFEMKKQIKRIPVEEKAPKKKLTNLQKISMIQDIIENEIKPSLKQDGGDIELVDVADNKVFVALRGTCTNCPSSSFTLKSGVEAKLKEYVSDELEVVEVAS